MRNSRLINPRSRLIRTGLPGFVVLAMAWTASWMLAGLEAQETQEAPTYDIYELQHSGPENDWASPHEGEIVRCVGGIVTHKFRQRIVLQDPSLGPAWAAIEVRGYPVYPTGIEVGDQADFDSVYVDEYRGVTVLQYYNASSHAVNSSGNDLPAPLPLSVWNFRYPPHPEDAERYAAMLVALPEHMTIGARDLGHHGDNYEIVSAGGDVAWGSDYANSDIDSTYYVASGDCYMQLTGIIQRYVNDTWDYYQFLPRGVADYIACSAAVPSEERAARLQWIAGGPNPFTDELRFVVELGGEGPVAAEVLEPTGRCIAQLLPGSARSGAVRFSWTGRDAGGRRVPSGIYFICVDAGADRLVRRVSLTR